MPYLQKIKLIDLRTSGVDKANSNPEKGEYTFKNGKRYVTYRGDKAAAPPYKFVWVRYYAGDKYRDVRDYKTNWKASEVTTSDPYWPEGIIPTNGFYIEGDVILMKVPILEYARKRKAEIERSEGRPDAVRRQFYNELAGMGLPTDQDMIDKLSEGRT